MAARVELGRTTFPSRGSRAVPTRAHDTDPRGRRRRAGTTQTKIVVPGSQAMVSLLGSGDELLRLVEAAVASDIHVRGNEITITGEPADNALAERRLRRAARAASRRARR